MIPRRAFCCLLVTGAAEPPGTVALDIVGTTIAVPVAVNGIPGRFILDTGAALTTVTPAAVERFGLALDEWTATTMRGVGGLERRRNANPRSVTIAGLPAHRRGLAGDRTFRVAALPHSGVDGLLGRDFLSIFDLDLDLRGNVLTLTEPTGHPPAWTAGIDPIPTDNPAEYALNVLAALDGVPMRALLDTGAGRTLVAAPGMARLALGLDRLREDPATVTSGLGPHTVTMWQHRFGTLRIGTEDWSQPTLLVAPIPIVPVADMLLGADWLLGRRIWISFGTRRLFATRRAP